MALVSVNLSKVNPIDLLGRPDVEAVKTELTKLHETDPLLAFDTSEMLELKNAIAEKSQLFGLPSSIDNLTPKDLSAVLFNSGVDPATFDISTYTIDISAIENLNNTISATLASAAGGIKEITAALATSSNPFELSMEDLNLSELLPNAAANFLSDIKGSVESLVESGSKSVSDIIAELDLTAANIEQQLQDQFDSLMESTEGSISDAEDFVKQKIKDVTAFYEAEADKLASQVPTRVAQNTDITVASSTNVQKDTLAKTAVQEATVAALPVALPASAPTTVKAIQKEFDTGLDEIKQWVSDVNVAKRKAQTAAFLKKYAENNPTAVTAELANSVKNQVAKENQEHDRVTQARVDELKRKITNTKPITKDIQNKSDSIAASSGLAGRQLVDKSAAVAAAVPWNGKNEIFESSYFGGPYAPDIAVLINNLHPAARLRFANAMRDLTTDENIIKAGIRARITSGTRSYAKQSELYRKYYGKSPVAYPGNSWHNYGCAIDIQVIVNGVSKSKGSNYYLGIPRKIFAKYGLTNPFVNDYIHFQPAELPMSARSVRARLITDRGKGTIINQEAVGALLA
jgi:hypothetical protein